MGSSTSCVRMESNQLISKPWCLAIYTASHSGGLKDLTREAPNVPIYVSREHWDAFGKHPFQAAIQGCAPQHWPKDFTPKMVDFSDHAVGPWEQSGKITSDGKILAVHTPGHVPGHLSLVVFGDNEDQTRTTYLLTGDATYGLDLLDKEEPDGINDDPETALRSLKLIKEFASHTDVVVLPSHDPSTPTTAQRSSVVQAKTLIAKSRYSSRLVYQFVIK